MTEPHTPGPWEFTEIDPTDEDWGACEVTANDGETYVSTMICGGLGNARLIAAAPDLLAALEALDVAMRNGFATQPTRVAGRDALVAARAAIAKARGQA